MRRLILSPAFVFAVVTAGVLLCGGPVWAGEHDRLEITTRTGTHRFIVEVMTSQDDRARGLMYRRTLAPDAGMLFDYGYEQPVAMWMKNTYIPLDMLFISKQGRVVNTAERAVPHSLRVIPSAQPVRAVLEVVAGTVSRLKIKAGDVVRHILFSSKATLND